MLNSGTYLLLEVGGSLFDLEEEELGNLTEAVEPLEAPLGFFKADLRGTAL